MVNHDLLDVAVWGTTCDCLRVCATALSRSVGTRCLGLTIPYVEDKPFRGIIARLHDEFGENLHEKGLVEITASGSSYDPCWRVTGWGSFWASPTSLVQFDFKGRPVLVTDYSQRSGNDGGNYFITWERSDDGTGWIAIDSRSTQELSSKDIVKTYSCKASGSLRYIRLRQSGKNSGGNDLLNLSEIEFFGSIRR